MMRRHGSRAGLPLWGVGGKAWREVVKAEDGHAVVSAFFDPRCGGWGRGFRREGRKRAGGERFQERIGGGRWLSRLWRRDRGEALRAQADRQNIVRGPFDRK